MAAPLPPKRPPGDGTGLSPLTQARARALQRRPAPTGAAPASAVAVGAAPRPPLRLARAARARAAAASRRGLSRGRRLFGPQTRGRACAALGLLALTPLVGPLARGAFCALLGIALARAEGRRRGRLTRSAHRGRWGRRRPAALPRGASLEVAARWFGRHGLSPARGAARRLVGGLVALGWAWVLGWEAATLAHLAWGCPTAADRLLYLSPSPLPPVAEAGSWELTPTRELRTALGLGLGLGLGLRGGRGSPTPGVALGGLVLRGLVWGLALRGLAHLRQHLLAGAIAGWGVGGGFGAAALMALGALFLGAWALRPLRRSPLWAALEGALVLPHRPGALRGLGWAFVGSVSASALALGLGLGLGFGGPGPEAWAP